MTHFNKKQFLLAILLLGITTCVVGQKWQSYENQDPKYGNMYFENKLSEAFFRYVEYGKSLTSQNYIVNDGFVRTFEEPPKNSTYPGHSVTGVKFRISLSKVKEEVFSRVIDTIVTDQAFCLEKHFEDYSESERKTLFHIDSCYLLDYSYRKAKYLFRLKDEIYCLQITKKFNHPFLVRKLFTKEQIPDRYLYLFFDQVGMYNDYRKNNYTYSFGFVGEDFSNTKKRITRLEFKR